MVPPDWLHLHEEIRESLSAHRPVVALESTLISHGLPWPSNLETALEAESVIRERGAIPATIAVLDGQPTVGLTRAQLELLAQASGVLKASRRDLPLAISKRLTAATTVAATMTLAHRAGISIFATGGIGGAHRDTGEPFDISADLTELARTPILVICAGAKSILDLRRTLEILETLSVPVVGYRTSKLPAFYVRESDQELSMRVETPSEAASLFVCHREVNGSGMLLTQPVESEVALDPVEFEQALAIAEKDAIRESIHGNRLTPFLLRRLRELTGGKTLTANRRLIVNNARLAAEVSCVASKTKVGGNFPLV
jgi:pseudouridine-5'-phosphate glycosidase